ncbi:adenine phosphoribosyltransferase [Helicobacter kayseriensis]|uniref:adenine phosphoribosyltransferase n=1 Tax=Helicobacter kayseriensis TaxID=2905877 RepID=UPI001E4CAB62|nr:adenine phosphoribosyltransferase [Helicobacter kayseriensis]MCE3046495.1 adenine phosphoribosyltransferase [Helicobacter kayseriensis]MCE3048202.1 adenine phosphoribosyltransferase [Helicobacter kayseriensis]
MRNELLSNIRCVQDYPKEGVLFRDITTLLHEGKVFRDLINYLKERYENEQIDFVVGLESRGFMLSAPLAYALGAGFVPIRKKGKLPYAKVSKTYTLEYGEDAIEIHLDAFKKKEGARVVLVDDLIATGGTAWAGVELIEEIGGKCIEACFLLDLVDFGGSSKLKTKTKVHSILEL